MNLHVEQIEICISICDDSMLALVRSLNDSEPFHAEQIEIGHIPVECSAMIHYLESR